MKPSLIVENSWKIKWFYFSLPTFAHLDLGSNIKTDKNKIVSKRPSFSISGSDHFLKNKMNQTQPTRIPSLTGPQAEMKPILEAPQIYFDQQENIYPSSDEVFSEEIQSHSYNSEDTKPPFQFPLAEYTKEVLNATKYPQHSSFPTPPGTVHKILHWYVQTFTFAGKWETSDE